MASSSGYYHRRYNQTNDRTYAISFYKHYIQATVTKDPDYVSSWISQTEFIYRRHLHHLIVGLDVEWRPCFIRGAENPVAVLQLCVGSRCLIFQILHAPSIPNSLVTFLNNPSYSFTGVGVRDDFLKLVRHYGLGREANVVDLRLLAAHVYDDKRLRNTTGLKSLTRLVLDEEVEKPKHITLSLWDRDRLSFQQVQYACLDAFLSFEIARVLISMQGDQ